MRPLLRILALWRGRTGILGLGAAIALASLGVGVALLAAWPADWMAAMTERPLRPNQATRSGAGAVGTRG